MDAAVPASMLAYLQLSRQLEALAQAEDWDAWLDLLPQRDAAFAELSAQYHDPAQLNTETRAILEEALQCNQRMEAMVDKRRHELTEVLHSMRQQHKVSQAYR